MQLLGRDRVYQKEYKQRKLIISITNQIVLNDIPWYKAFYPEEKKQEEDEEEEKC